MCIWVLFFQARGAKHPWNSNYGSYEPWMLGRKATYSERTVCILNLRASSSSPLPPVCDSVQDGVLMECLHSHYIFNFLFFEIIVTSNLLSLPFLFCKPSHTCVLFLFMFVESFFINCYLHVWTYTCICIYISKYIGATCFVYVWIMLIVCVFS